MKSRFEKKKRNRGNKKILLGDENKRNKKQQNGKEKQQRNRNKNENKNGVETKETHLREKTVESKNKRLKGKKHN